MLYFEQYGEPAETPLADYTGHEGPATCPVFGRPSRTAGEYAPRLACMQLWRSRSCHPGCRDVEVHVDRRRPSRGNPTAEVTRVSSTTNTTRSRRRSEMRHQRFELTCDRSIYRTRNFYLPPLSGSPAARATPRWLGGVYLDRDSKETRKTIAVITALPKSHSRVQSTPPTYVTKPL